MSSSKPQAGTYGAPKTKGDRLPTVRHPTGFRYKDGVEERWSPWEAKAIRMLADPMGPVTFKSIAAKCKIKLTTLKRWMKNPYFIQAVNELGSHILHHHRAQVLGTLVSRAKEGNMTAVRMYLQLTEDLKDGSGGGGIHVVNNNAVNAHSNLSEEEIDSLIKKELQSLRADESVGDYAERISREEHFDKRRSGNRSSRY